MADVEVTFGGAVEGLQEAATKATELIEGVGSTITGLAAPLKAIGELIAVAFGVEMIVKFAEQMGELAIQTERSMAQLGLTAEQIGNLRGVATLTGTSFEGMQNAFERMSLNVQRSTRDGFNPAAQSLHALGLSAKELIGLPADQYFEKLADAVSKFAPSLERTNAVMAIGGRGVAQLLPMLALGAEHFREFEQRVAATGSAMSGTLTAATAKTHEEMTILGLTIEGARNALWEKLQPAILVIVEELTKFVAGLRDAIKEGGSFSGVVDLLAGGLKTVMTLFSGIVLSARLATDAIIAFYAATSGDTKTALIQLAAMDNALHTFRETWQAMWSEKTHIDVPVAGALKAPPIDMSAHDALLTKLKQIDEQIKTIDQRYQQLKTTTETSVAMFSITENQKIAILQAANSTRFAEINKLYNDEISLAGNNAKEVAAITAKKMAELNKITEEALKLQEEMVKKSVKQWESDLGTITGAFNSQLRGLLAGTETWSQAMQKIAQDLVIKLIEKFEQLAVIEPMINAFVKAGFAAPTDILTGIIKAIMANVGSVIASVSAAVAPAMGPAAPAAPAVGIAAGAAVESAALAAVGKFDIGSDFILSPGLAYLHSGETVVPAAQSLGPYSGGSPGAGSGPSFHFNGPVIGNQAWINSMIPQLARSLAAYQRINPSVAG